MKKFLKYSLLLLTFIGFLASSLELDGKECKQNYNKETHIYFSSKPDTSQTSHLEIAAALPAYILSLWFADQVLQPADTCYSIADPNPPERLYLRYSVLLI